MVELLVREGKGAIRDCFRHIHPGTGSAEEGEDLRNVYMLVRNAARHNEKAEAIKRWQGNQDEEPLARYAAHSELDSKQDNSRHAADEAEQCINSGKSEDGAPEKPREYEREGNQNRGSIKQEKSVPIPV